ncbi:hypothetical protein ACTXT7_001208 [Hymenolepis weldensis]
MPRQLPASEKRRQNQSTALSYLISPVPHNPDCPSLVLTPLLPILIPNPSSFSLRLKEKHQKDIDELEAGEQEAKEKYNQIRARLPLMTFKSYLAMTVLVLVPHSDPRRSGESYLAFGSIT